MALFLYESVIETDAEKISDSDLRAGSFDPWQSWRRWGCEERSILLAPFVAKRFGTTEPYAMYTRFVVLAILFLCTMVTPSERG